jgi:ATP-dependent DNA helicase RecG
VTSPLDEPLTRLAGSTAKQLATGLDLHTVGDLMRHYPRRYYELGELTDLSELTIGEVVTIQAQVVSLTGRQIRRKLHKLDVVVTDGTGRLTLTFFNKAWLADKRDLVPGQTALFSGKVELFNKKLQLTQPEYELDESAESFAGRLMPVYPTARKIKNVTIRKAVRTVLDTLSDLDDPLPADLRQRRGLLPLLETFQLIHRPASYAEVRRARDRLRWDEAFVLQVALAQRRAVARSLPATPRLAGSDGILAAFDRRLPFELTAGQQEVGEQLAADLALDHPMQRLLQGEVGSGKTICALRAMLAVVDAGGQAALLAPTEVLAQQHHRSIKAMLGDLAEAGLLGGADNATRVRLLTGSQGTAARREALLDAASGEAGIVIGTHALIQDNVSFFDLGLVVIDEQHRFGVEQRDALRGKAAMPPHLLVMTATPIPRTVAMTVFGDLEVSTLAELPRGRSPISTHVVPAGERPNYLERTWERVREEVAAGHQAYVVCPRIGDDEGAEDDQYDDAPRDVTSDGDGGARRAPLAVRDVADLLRDGPLAGLRLEVLHGRMPPDAKDDVMRRFGAGEVDVLVATTVVEVGVDVPNATVMVVMDADRFGVSQLHQLRGRVGRGEAPGLCLLVTDVGAPSPARDRLDAVAATLDGFELSRIDLEQRREGDVLGATQSGRRSSLRLLAVIRDEELIREARQEADAIVEADPTLDSAPGLRAALKELLDDERADYLEKA